MSSPSPAGSPPLLRRLETPSRETLLDHYRRTEEHSKVLLWAEAFLGVVAIYWLAFQASHPLGPWPWVAAGLGGLGVFRWLAHHVFLNKKRLEQIRPDAQFGVHTRASLLALTRQVFERLRLPRNAAPVFLTREKDINAQALRCELWPGMRLFNGVFLNRSIIHLLDEAELASVIGHELGHVFPYAPIVARSYALHACVCAAVSAALTSAFPSPGVALIAPLGLLWILDYVIAFPQFQLSRGIEFLCDDFGAQAAGLLPALSAEVKISVEQETRLRLFHQTLADRAHGAAMDLPSLVAAYDAAIPFGKADPATFERELRQVAAEQRQQDRSVSAGGFVRFLQSSDQGQAEQWTNEQLALAQALDQLPIAPENRAAYLKGSQHWTPRDAETLTRAIEQTPGTVFARLPDEVDDRALSHPSVSRRLLYLWRARAHYPPHA